MSIKNYNVIIIGAGITGLTAGYMLAKSDYIVNVVERNSLHGGLARSIRYETKEGNFTFDIGGHRFFSRNKEVNQFIINLMKDELIRVPRKSRYFFRRKWKMQFKNA